MFSSIFNKSKPDEVIKKTTTRRERSLLSETIQVEEELLPGFVTPLLALTTIVVVLFVVWAGFTQVNEVARGTGEVIPSGQVKVVQHLDGGIISSIHVDERMAVDKDQVLVRLEGDQAKSELHQTETRLMALQLRAERLKAFTEAREPDFDSITKDDSYKRLVDAQKELLAQQLAAKKSALAVVDKQIAQRKSRLGQQRQLLDAASDQQQLTRELSQVHDHLSEKKLVPKVLALETKRADVSAIGEVNRIKAEMDVSNQELSEAKNKWADIDNQLRKEALGELGSVMNELAEVEKSLERQRSRVERLVVRAPAKGLIHDLKALTVGQVIQPGGLLMQIVPDKVQLEAELRISPQDVGHVRDGQPVNMRVTSYDYARYGYATGTLKRVSATAFADPATNKPYFKAWVILNNSFVGKDATKNPIIPGMSLEAEITTGEKTLLMYVAKPLSELFTKSFKER